MGPGTRVWILGAGFSRSLGGPLLGDLLRPEVPANVAAGPDIDHAVWRDEFIDAVLWTYWYGRRFSDRSEKWHDLPPGELLWDDPEQFLDALDTEALAPPGQMIRSKRITEIAERYFRLRSPSGARGMPENILQGLVAAAKRLIAASCCLFMRTADSGTERWSPYVKWAENLSTEDTVVTFNYDAVPEWLNRRTRRMRWGGLNAEPAGPATVYKMHGSVTWKLDLPPDYTPGDPNAMVRFQLDHDSYALNCPAQHLAIASPGPSKRHIARFYSRMWNDAMSAIRNADSVVFLGYRFPPSDSDAREQILGALSENKQPYLAVHTVLGPRLDDDTERLREMLNAAVFLRGGRAERTTQNGIRGTANIIVHRLWAQDFLSLFGAKDIVEGWRVLRLPPL